MASSYAYLPKGTPVDVLGYWFPANHKGPVANDLMVSLTSGSNPVLSHMFINYFLDTHNALDNYSYYGYMTPLNGVTPQRLISEKLLPPQLTSTVVLPSYFRHGIFQLELPPAANTAWENAWNTFSHGL
jgi:spermidine/putrescine transport system substrate-binding protein